MFIQIGDLYINQDHIVTISDDGDEVFFLLAANRNGTPMWESFVDEERQAILDWLAYRAEVSKVC